MMLAFDINSVKWNVPLFCWSHRSQVDGCATTRLNTTIKTSKLKHHNHTAPMKSHIYRDVLFY